MLYTRDQEKLEDSGEPPEKKKAADDDGSVSVEESGLDPWAGLDEAARHTFKVSSVYGLRLCVFSCSYKENLSQSY